MYFIREKCLLLVQHLSIAPVTHKLPSQPGSRQNESKRGARRLLVRDGVALGEPGLKNGHQLMLQPVITSFGLRHGTGTAQVGQRRFIHTVRTVRWWPEGLVMNPTAISVCKLFGTNRSQWYFIYGGLTCQAYPLFPALAWRMALPSGHIMPGSQQGASYVSLVEPTNGEASCVFKPKGRHGKWGIQAS